MNTGDRRQDAATARLRDLAWAQVDASVVTDRDGEIVDWNDGATRLFGWTPEEALGATWEDLAGPVAADPDPRRAVIRDRLEAAAPYTGDLTVATKSGERIPILVAGGPIRDEDDQDVGSIGFAIDDRRRSLAEERFDVAFREAPVASVITTGERQLILDVNPALGDLIPAAPLADDGPATILVVDDETSIRLLARRVLERRGHRVIEASDGVAALEALADVKTLDLVVTDLTMPRMGGVEMVERLADLWPDTPVIFMSGYGEFALGRDGVLDPTIRLLSKPFAIDDLTAMVQGTLAERA